MKMTKTELAMIISLHQLWLIHDPKGIRANLSGADLSGANLRSADLRSANLSGADLSGANLRSADLRSANLRSANLRSANLSGADLSGADLSGADLPHFQLCSEGELIVFKKLNDNVIATLLIPKKAKRTSSLVGRKCRAEYAKVIALSGNKKQGTSMHDDKIVYKKGKVIRPDKYDSDIRIECTNGIHFFITKKEAQEY